jgi:hypothetical protein
MGRGKKEPERGVKGECYGDEEGYSFVNSVCVRIPAREITEKEKPYTQVRPSLASLKPVHSGIIFL